MSGGVLLEARGLRHSFGARTVLAGVDLALGPGEMLGLVGPNGSGKTTLLRLLHRSLVPEAGQVLLEGVDLAALPGRERARRLAVLAQESAGDVPLRVADVVLLGRLPYAGAFGASSAEDHAQAAEALELVGALHLAGQEFTRLSGGERQRVLIARALVQEPRVLLLDEPTNHLDIGAQHQVLRIVREQRLATIVVLHDLNLAARYCDRVMVLREGVVAADGPPPEVLGAGLVEDLYDVSAEPVRAADGTAQLLFRGDGACWG